MGLCAHPARTVDEDVGTCTRFHTLSGLCWSLCIDIRLAPAATVVASVLVSIGLPAYRVDDKILLSGGDMISGFGIL